MIHIARYKNVPFIYLGPTEANMWPFYSHNFYREVSGRKGKAGRVDTGRGTFPNDRI